jgi:hypothetical protein
MNSQELDQAVMDLPEKERLDLARRIISSVTAEREIAQKVSSAVRGIEDLVTGKVAGLSESEFRERLR